MKMRASGWRVLLAFALAGLCFGAVARAQETAMKGAESKGAPTVAEAQAFLEEAEQRVFDLGNKQQRASWVQENFITDDT
ncbi:MAG: hypothetical protein ACRD36_00890, partial [Candidatus Acidiferrum sp.]